MHKALPFKTLLKIVTILLLLSILILRVNAQELSSTNYKILDPTVDSGGGVSTSANYDFLQSIGDPTADSRLQSTNYEIGSGFPNGIQANVPLIRCAEATTTSGTTACLDLPAGNGAIGECGSPGCYDRAKIEVDHQSNPIDALYLVSILNTTTSVQYYLQSDHSISTTYDLSDYMTICDIQGKDTRSGSGCATLGDPSWDATLQSRNVLGLNARTTYTVSVRALNGDFTESKYSPTVNVLTSSPTLVFDIDTGALAGSSTTAPYSFPLPTLTAGGVHTASRLIWLDMDTNMVNGMNMYVKDTNAGLYNGSFTIGSDAEDLTADPDGDGGFGLKISTSTETSQGPILEGPIYATVGAEQVGNVALTNNLLYYTNTTGSNKGSVAGGRGGVWVKAKVTTATPTGNYSDRLIFTMTSNP